MAGGTADAPFQKISRHPKTWIWLKTLSSGDVNDRHAERSQKIHLSEYSGDIMRVTTVLHYLEYGSAPTQRKRTDDMHTNAPNEVVGLV